MKITCDSCGTAVSSEVPEGTALEAYVECVECIEVRVKDDPDPCPSEWVTASGTVDRCRRLGTHWSHRGDIAEWAPARFAEQQRRRLEARRLIAEHEARHGVITSEEGRRVMTKTPETHPEEFHPDGYLIEEMGQ